MQMDGQSSAAAEHLVLFTSQDGAVSVQAAIARESIWLTQEQLALVFEVKRPAITKHLGNIYKSNELDEESTCSILEHVGQGGSRTYPTRYYNLDAIIAVGYRTRGPATGHPPPAPAGRVLHGQPTSRRTRCRMRSFLFASGSRQQRG